MASGSFPLSPISQFASESEDGDDVISLSPSITNYPTRWGRRYHRYKDGMYLLPNDEPELQRLDMQHDVIKRLHSHQLIFSPVSNARRILDLGTGTGVWPIEVADSGLVPRARITGTDLSPVQPNDVPENVSFEIADWSEKDWCRRPDSIDLVHLRMALFSLNSYKDLMHTAKFHLRPGSGWLELHELDPRPRCDDDTMPSGWPLEEWEKKMSRGVRNMAASNSLHNASKLSRWMEEAGYVDVTEVVYKIPIGSWPRDKVLKHIGLDWAEVIFDGLPGFSYKILGQEGLQMNRTEIEVMLTGVRKCLMDRNVHAYMNFHTVFGRKPDLRVKKEKSEYRPR